jgi:prolipoprotein diacylglyceryltransferase
MFGLYLMWYSTGRFFIEGIRLDPSDVYLGLRTNQWSAILAFLVGLGVLMYQRAKHSGIEVSGYLEGREPKEATKSKDTFEDSEVELPESEELPK